MIVALGVTVPIAHHLGTQAGLQLASPKLPASLFDEEQVAAPDGSYIDSIVGPLPRGKKADPDPAILAEIRAYRPAGGMKPWLKLIDDEFMRTGDGAHQRANTFKAIFAVLPDPSQWPSLKAILELRSDKTSSRSAVLRLLADILQDNRSAERVDILDWAKAVQANRLPADQVKDMATRLAMQNEDADSFALAMHLTGCLVSGRSEVALPALVPVLGRPMARQIIERLLETDVLTTGSHYLQAGVDLDTLTLCGQVIIERADRLAFPQWPIAAELQDRNLTEALLRRFPSAPRDGESMPSYLAVLDSQAAYRIAAGEDAEVTRDILANKGGLLYSQTVETRDGPTSQTYADFKFYGPQATKEDRSLYGYLGRLLANNPGLPLWTLYVKTAERCGTSFPMVDRVLAALRAGEIPSYEVNFVRIELWHLLVGIGRISDGVGVLLQCANSSDYLRTQSGQNAAYLGHHLAAIGALTNRLDWVRKGVRIGQSQSVAQVLSNFKLARGTTARSLVEQATKFDDAQMWSEAARRYAAYFRKAPKSLSAEFRCARLYEVLGQFERARRHYRHAFEMVASRVPDPDLYQDGEFFGPFDAPIALAAFSIVAKKDPKNPNPHLWASIAEYFGHRVLDARRELTLAESLGADGNVVAQQTQQLEQTHFMVLRSLGFWVGAFGRAAITNFFHHVDLRREWEIDGAAALAKEDIMRHLADELAICDSRP